MIRDLFRKEQSMSATPKYPSLVMIIRHGEKPGNPADESGGKHLSLMGSARAAALPSLFTPAPSATPITDWVQLECDVKPASTSEFSGSFKSSSAGAGASRFPVPNFLFACQSDKNSHRPLETITPLGQALGITPKTDYSDNDYDKQAKDILKKSDTYGGHVVLICWHHGKAPDLAKSFGVSKQQLTGWDPWNPSVFDLVFMITWTGDTVNFAVDYQELLFNDTVQP
jgi:hypothetical protein